jgi:hypothetical protein
MAKSKKNDGIELITEDQTSDNAEVQKPKQKAVLTLFLFLLPILLMAYSNDFITKIALFFYEAVLLQNYIMDRYKEA